MQSLSSIVRDRVQEFRPAVFCSLLPAPTPYTAADPLAAVDKIWCWDFTGIPEYLPLFEQKILPHSPALSDHLKQPVLRAGTPQARRCFKT
jgi:hypothetical protein